MGLLDIVFGAKHGATAGRTDRTATLAAAIETARAPTAARAGRGRPYGMQGARFMQSADVGRLTSDWTTTPLPADEVVRKFHHILVARSREQAHNNDWMRSYLRLQRNHIAGPTGVLFQSLALDRDGEPDQDARQAVDRAYADFSRREHFDVAGKLSRAAMEKAIVVCAARDGEAFARLVTGRQHGGKYGVRVQMLDPQRCPVDFDRDDMRDGNFIRQGIEFTPYGEPVAYYFTAPESERSALAYSYGGRKYQRIPAAEIIHAFVPDLPGQRRGLPWTSTGLFRAKQASAMEDAAVVNARVGAAKLGFIEFKDGQGPDYDEDEGLEIDGEPGTFPVLPNGATLNKWDAQYPNGEFSPFMKHLLHGFAAGGGVSYHSLTGDLTDVNFSSIRQGELDARETYKDRQEWLIEEFCDRVFDAWLMRAILAGLVVGADGRAYTVDRLAALRARSWQGRRWEWIDPRADSAAAELQKNNFLESPGELIRKSGRDPEKVWAEYGANIESMRRHGIPDEFIALSLGLKQPAATAAKKTEANEE